MGKRDNNDRGLRGGSWNNNENNLRASNRNNNTPTNENNNIGFRLASLCGRTGITRLENWTDPWRKLFRHGRARTETTRFSSVPLGVTAGE